LRQTFKNQRDLHMASFSLKNKRVLITGAASGIGYELALAFAKQGCEVIATDIQEDALKELQQEIHLNDGNCDIYPLNVTEVESWQALAYKLAEQNQTPDILINNAGIAYIASLMETTQQMLDRTLDINIKGVVYGCQAFIPEMTKSSSPKHIVNVASAASKAPMPNMAIYAATKFAVEGFSDVLAMELHNSNINVMCVHPGIIDTEIVKQRAMIGASISNEQINKLQNHYTSKGCHPSVVAEDIVNGIQKGQAAILTGPGAFFGGVLSRVLPKRLLRTIIRKLAPKYGYLK